jgi:phosphatidylinositol alpha-mannosyltransferase
LKIALVSPYDFASYGGVTGHITQLAGEFQRREHTVHIMAPCSTPAPPSSTVEFHRLGYSVSVPANGSVARISMGSRLGAEIKQIMATVAFDIVHLHEPLLPALPLAVLRASTATNVGTFHAYRQSNFAYFYGKPLLKYFFGRLHGRIAVSACARDFVARQFPGDYRVIPNGIHSERYSLPQAPLVEFADGRLNVLFVGRLEERKGLSHLLRAWPMVHEACPEARLIVVGGGRGLKHYQSFEEKRSSDDIVFAGLVPDAELPRFYQAADIFCAPSTGQESFGIVLLEAMAAGKAIVTTNIPGYAEVVTDQKEGLLVAPRDPVSLAAAIIRLLNDAELRRRFGAQGRCTAQAYSWDRVADRVLDYYTEAMHRRELLDAIRRPRFRSVRTMASGMASLLTRPQ